eukprot:8935399-Lingulodinium_polyedra.AAC.1
MKPIDVKVAQSRGTPGSLHDWLERAAVPLPPEFASVSKFVLKKFSRKAGVDRSPADVLEATRAALFTFLTKILAE